MMPVRVAKLRRPNRLPTNTQFSTAAPSRMARPATKGKIIQVPGTRTKASSDTAPTAIPTPSTPCPGSRSPENPMSSRVGIDTKKSNAMVSAPACSVVPFQTIMGMAWTRIALVTEILKALAKRINQ